MKFSSHRIKISLVNPRLTGPYPPLGLAYLASYLKKYGRNDYEVRVFDGNYSRNIIKDILDFSPAIVGFTALSLQIEEAVNLSAVINSKIPDILQIIGGIHVSAEPESTLRRGKFDLAVIGEGEETFREIVDNFAECGKTDKFYSKIKGVAYLDDGSLVINPPREEIDVLDRIPQPDRMLLNMKGYLSNYLMIRGLSGNGITTIHTSRGCPYSCAFCSCGIVFKKVRYFSVEYVISEVKDLIEKFKIKALFFTDDIFILNKERVKKICQRFIEEGINKKIKWEVQGRANLIDWQDLGLLRLMKEANCVQIDYGFETGSDGILKFLKKKDASIEFNRRAIEITKKAGLNVMGTFMVGIPGETAADIDLTKNFVLENRDKIDNFQIFIATPYPGAELYEICCRKNLVKRDYFEQLSKEKEKGFSPSYTDTIPCDKINETQRMLNRLALKKIRFTDKVKWLLYNFFMNPLGTFKKVRASLSR
jgi:radical SAM superfamily enzyme YgiQ (UPF0313 family)